MKKHFDEILVLLIFLALPLQISCYCYYGTEYINGTGCFQFFRTPLNFTNALRFCRVNMDANLVRSLNYERNSQLKDAAYKLGIEDFWIGSSNVDNDWLWLDGSELFYSNFDLGAGYPRKTESQIGAVSMLSMSGLWYTKSDSMKLPFVCEMGKSEDYDQGILYRAPKTRGLRFPYSRMKDLLMVQAADQAPLYDKVGPSQNEVETGDKVYLKPLAASAFPSMQVGSPPMMVIMNRRRIRKKVQPVIVAETETKVDREMKEKEEEEVSRNLKMKQNSEDASSPTNSTNEQELNENARKSKETEAKESILTKTRVIQRG